MLKIVPAFALLLLGAMQTLAYAATCEGQEGTVVFEDDFTDDSGGWAHEPGPGWDASFGKSGLALRIQKPITNYRLLNVTFTATEGDFCVEAVMPKAAAGITIIKSGLLFLASDYANFYALMIGVSAPQQRGAELWRSNGGNWSRLGAWPDPKIKLDPGSVVALRAVVKPNLITATVNGAELKKQRIQQPGYNLKFGVYVEVDKAVPAPGVTFQFKRYKVTARE